MSEEAKAHGEIKKEGYLSMIKEIQSLLESNLNVILTGAPGTGKTCMAREVARAMVGASLPANPTDDDKKWAAKAEKERIEFVQFHPGYDYADFVIGKKPVLISAETGKEVFRDKNGILFTTDTGKEDGARTPFSGKTEATVRWEDGIFKKFADKAKADPNCNYVFLIDEINRADLSRVFGELFSLLEKESRCPSGKGTGITLPNGEHFGIPGNLYVIGTMNDIDRRVEGMDFAIRRRFAWHEVTAEQSEGIIRKKVSDPTAANALLDAMHNLNAVFGGDIKLQLENGTETYLRLGTAYQLSGAIFAKFGEYAGGDDPFGKLWRNHIENILKEYLCGQSNRDDLLKGLWNVYRQSVSAG